MTKSVARLRQELEKLPVHEITGYEWECYGPDTGCHYHSSQHPCEYGHPAEAEGNFDRDGVRCEHDSLLDRARVMTLLDRWLSA